MNLTGNLPEKTCPTIPGDVFTCKGSPCACWYAEHGVLIFSKISDRFKLSELLVCVKVNPFHEKNCFVGMRLNKTHPGMLR